MAQATVKVKGLKELQRDLRKIDTELAAEIREALKAAAAPVADDAAQRMERYKGGSQNIRPRASVKGAFVRQNARKVTGKKGDFGSLQMREVLIPALVTHSDEIEKDLETLLDHLASRNGFAGGLT